MRLTEIAEQVLQALETAPPEMWSGLKPVSEVPVIIALYPTQVFSRDGKAIYILCNNVEYNVTEPKTGRPDVIAETRTKLISVIAAMKLTDVDPDNLDITSWEEGKSLLNLKEEIDEALVRYGWSRYNLRLSSVETEPPAEAELGTRYFIAATQFGFIDKCTLR